MRQQSFHSITVEGIDVRFPFEPYPEQIQYMGTVLRALNNNTMLQSSNAHAVLESPTGSGKTLALLCSVCAWVMHQKKLGTLAPESSRDSEQGPLTLRGDEVISGEVSGKEEQNLNVAETTRILYTTRTHSQVAQAIKEFRRSGYDKHLSSCILGSREHMCIEPRVMQHKKSPTMVKAACRHLCSRHKCSYKRGVSEHAMKEARKSNSQGNSGEFSICDIEELQVEGKKSMFCPFFYTREVLLPKAEIIFCPYNYVLDPSIASQIDAGMASTKQPGGPDIKSIGSFLENSILIIDEAHNLPSTCLGVSSIDLSTKDIDRAVYEASKELKLAEQKMRESDIDLEAESSGSKKKKEKRSPEEDAKELQVLCKLLCNVEKHMVSFPIKHHEQTQTLSHHSKGDSVYEFLSSLNISSKTSHYLADMLERTIDSIVERSDAMISTDTSFTGLQSVSSFIRFIFPLKETKSSSSKEIAKCDDAKCALRLEELRTAYAFVVQKINQSKFFGKGAESDRDAKHVMSLWCMDAALTMQRLHKIVRNVIVTSGTLSPISSFIHELKIPFYHVYPPAGPIRKTENLSVVKKSDPAQRVCVSICPRGCCDTELNSSYTKRDTVEYKTSLGNSIVNLFRIIPDGVLIFFPSYAFMRNTLTYWGYGKGNPAGTIWEKMQRHKALFIEETSKSRDDREKVDISEIIEQYRATLEAKDGSMHKGAALFAVCRGRLSEGIDFADALARGVIIVGIPYMNVADLNVFLRKKYFDEVSDKARKQIATEGNSKTFNPAAYLTGDVWYQQESMRAVNQAMGRAIRHKYDYGAIILLDSRFRSKQTDLSGWVRPYTEVSDAFAESTMRIASFFRNKAQYRQGVATIVDQSKPKAQTATKRHWTAIESAQSAVKYEQEAEAKENVKAEANQGLPPTQAPQDSQPLKIHPFFQKGSQIAPSGSMRRSSSAPRSFFGVKKEE